MRDSRLDLQPGDRFLDFSIGRPLGCGGVGVVHEITYRGQRQALKLIRPEWVNDPAMVPRMFNEGQILMRINHPSIVAVHDAGITGDNWVWIRMELLDGLNLREATRRSGPMSLPRICAFLRTAAHAAHQCHVFGIIHRDIKPENFMVVQDEDGDHVLKLLDFGLAKLYGAESVDLRLIGTPQYMAPEQWNKELPVSPATDIYAIGTMMHETYVGHHPLFPDGKEDNPWRMMKAHHETVPVPLEHYGMPPEISDLIMMALEKDPAKRPQDSHQWAEAVWAAWRKVRDGHPEIDTHPGEPPLDRIRSRPLVVTATNPLSPWKPPVQPTPISHAGTQRMRATPQGLRRPSPMRPAHEARAPRAGFTVKLPHEQRDPSCVAAEAQAPAVLAACTVPIPPEIDARPLSPGSTGTVPISLTAVPAAAALPFRPRAGEPPPPPPREAALAIAAAPTAPLDGATSGVRPVERPAGELAVASHAGQQPPETVADGAADQAAPRPRPRSHDPAGWKLPAAARYGVPALAAFALAGALWVRKAPDERGGSVLEAPSSIQALPSPAVPPATAAPSTSEAPAVLPATAAPSTSEAPAVPPATAAPSSSEAPAATHPEGPAPTPLPPATPTVRPKPPPVASVTPDPTATTVPSVRPTKLPTNPGVVPTAAPTTKKPRLPTNPAPRLPAGPEPDLPGGSRLD